jgi:hypothetical protein
MSRIRTEDEDEPVSLTFPKRTAPIKYGVSRSRLGSRGPPSPCQPGSLNRIAAALRRFQADFRNSDFYVYRTDGNAIYINDGGDDMYDGGNFTTPWLRSGELYVEDPDDEVLDVHISYAATTETIVDGDFRYVSLGYVQTEDNEGDGPAPDDSRHPLMVLGSRCSGPVGWQISGNMGADGGGSTQLFRLYSGETVEGFQVHAAARQIWGQRDPVVCNVILLIGAPSWSSRFGPVGVFGNDDTNENGFYFYAGDGSRSILAVHFLLSKPAASNETPIAPAEVTQVIGRFLSRLAAA